MVPNRPAQDRMTFFQGIQDAAQRNWLRDINLHFACDAREVSQMIRQLNADHGSICTSTEQTAGKSRTMGFQLSPLSAEA